MLILVSTPRRDRAADEPTTSNVWEIDRSSLTGFKNSPSLILKIEYSRSPALAS